jgi:hypothetical protein
MIFFLLRISLLLRTYQNYDQLILLKQKIYRGIKFCEKHLVFKYGIQPDETSIISEKM